jgi:ubiquinol-cytochrome c reductase cytochrome c subunit
MNNMRYPMFRVALAALAAGVVLGHAPVLAAGDAAKGKAAFVKYGCWQCHGFEGQGSAITSNGKVLAPDPLPWEGFSSFVRTSNGGMPPYSEKILPNGDLEDIHAYLASVPKPKDVKSIPLLSQQ